MESKTIISGREDDIRGREDDISVPRKTDIVSQNEDECKYFDENWRCVCKGRQLEVERKTIVIAMPMEMKMLISIPVKTNVACAKEVNLKLPIQVGHWHWQVCLCGLRQMFGHDVDKCVCVATSNVWIWHWQVCLCGLRQMFGHDIDRCICGVYVKCLDITLTSVFVWATSNVWTWHWQVCLWELRQMFGLCDALVLIADDYFVRMVIAPLIVGYSLEWRIDRAID